MRNSRQHETKSKSFHLVRPNASLKCGRFTSLSRQQEEGAIVPNCKTHRAVFYGSYSHRSLSLICFNKEPTQTSATTPATFNKMALRNQHLNNCLAIIIALCLHSSILWKYAAAGLEATPLKFMRRI